MARERLEHLASVFAVDCLTFSIMSNHTHQILRSRPDVVETWGDREVATRWLRLTPKRDKLGNPIEPAESDIIMLVNNAVLLAKVRIRFSDVSWWMRYFSHHMACRTKELNSLATNVWNQPVGVCNWRCTLGTAVRIGHCGGGGVDGHVFLVEMLCPRVNNRLCELARPSGWAAPPPFSNAFLDAISRSEMPRAGKQWYRACLTN